MKVKQIALWRRVFTLLHPEGTVTQQEQFIKLMSQGTSHANQY